MTILQRFWAEETGAVISAELILMGTLLVIGLIVGMATLRDHVVQEIADIAGGIGDLNQTYSYSGISGHHSTMAGADFTDLDDKCDLDTNNDGAAGTGAQCVAMTAAIEE